MDSTNIYLIPFAGVLALAFTYMRAQWVAQQDPGTDRMRNIAGYITDGAMAFLRAEYSKLAWFVVAVAVLLALTTQGGHSSPLIALSFVVGATCSALAGFIGMKVATKANVRTAHAARTGLASALNVAFRGGSVMGMGVVGLGVLGLSGLFFFYHGHFDHTTPEGMTKILAVLTGFSFGASSIALFARVGGGIYTKAADVGADLVGKVEAGIPEDHPLNPATIADNVGDNVGDVAGMGADLFESYVGSMIGAMVLGVVLMGLTEFESFKGGIGAIGVVMLPLCLAAIGIVASMIGTMFVSVEEGGDPKAALTRGELTSAVIMLAGGYFLIKNLLPAEWVLGGTTFTSIGVFYASLIGLACGLGIGFVTEYYTGFNKEPVREIARESAMGEIDNYRDNWWCAEPSTYYQYNEQDKKGKSISVACLSEEERAKGIAEYNALKALGPAPNILVSRVLAFSGKKPGDPRLAETLHLAVRATRYGCTDDHTTEFSKKAFKELHKSFPGNKWTKKTPYWF